MAVDKDSVNGSGFAFTITSSEDGKYHYAVMRAEDTAPTREALLSQNIPGAIVGTGNLSAEQEGQPLTVTISGLESNTAYTVYAVAEDTDYVIENIALALVLTGDDHRQSVFLTQPVAGTADKVIAALITVVVFMIHEADGIENQVVMDMPLVNVGGQYKFILAAQDFICELISWASSGETSPGEKACIKWRPRL